MAYQSTDKMEFLGTESNPILLAFRSSGGSAFDWWHDLSSSYDQTTEPWTIKATKEQRSHAIKVLGRVSRLDAIRLQEEERATERGGHLLIGKGPRKMHPAGDKPRCVVCGCSIFGDENVLPNRCSLTKDKRHVYPNGEKAPALHRHLASSFVIG